MSGRKYVDCCGLKKADFLAWLPPEISLRILMLLSPNDLLACSRVCHAWYRLVNCNKILQTLCTDFDVGEDYLKSDKDVPDSVYPMVPHKVLYFRYMKIVNNWRKNTCKNITLKLTTKDRPVCSAFHGATLAVGFENNTVSVFISPKGRSFNLVQILNEMTNYDGFDICALATNTRYMVVKYGAFIIVYKLVNKLYEVLHLLFDVVYTFDTLYSREISILKGIDNLVTLFRVCTQEESIIIHGNILYFHMSHKSVLYLWDIEGYAFKAKIETKPNFSMIKHKDIVYISNKKLITYYNTFGEIENKIETRGEIKQFYCNRNILLACCQIDDNFMEEEVLVWDRKSGQLLFERDIAIPYDFLLHPLCDVIIYVHSTHPYLHVSKCEIEAFDLREKKVIWKTLIQKSHYNVGCTFDIVAGRFLLFNTPPYGTCPYMSSVVDTFSGKYLYTMAKTFRLILSAPNVTVFASEIKQQLKIKIY